MKKLFLVMVIAILAIGCVFADNAKSLDEMFDYGQIMAGGSIGYLPDLKAAQFEATGRWQLDFTEMPWFTTDLVATMGVVTNFSDVTAFDMFVGAGASKYIAKYWNFTASVGLDLMVNKTICNLGVAGNVGCEFFVTEYVAINLNFKLAKYIESDLFTFRPSFGVAYAF